MRNILLILGAIAALAVIAVAAIEYFGAPGQDEISGPGSQTASPAGVGAPEPLETEIGADEFIIGDANAPVTIVEYASLSCSHCARFHLDTLPNLKKAYIDTGKVRLVYRDFPLDRPALRGSMMARCAGRARFFGFIDTLFKRQASWSGADDPVAALARIGRLGGLGKSAFDACMKNKAIEDQVLAMRLKGEKKFGVNATPSFIVNGRLYAGALTFEEFDRILAPLVN